MVTAALGLRLRALLGLLLDSGGGGGSRSGMPPSCRTALSKGFVRVKVCFLGKMYGNSLEESSSSESSSAFLRLYRLPLFWRFERRGGVQDKSGSIAQPNLKKQPNAYTPSSVLTLKSSLFGFEMLIAHNGFELTWKT